MGLTLETVIPWGRCLDEYVRMFDLSPAQQQSLILDCAGGPASFNSEMTKLGNKVISCDPIYQFSAAEIQQRIHDTYDTLIQGVTKYQENYVWREITSPSHLGMVRMAAMQQFLQDLPIGIQQGRYINAELPILPFKNRQFDLALCGHFLFTYADVLSGDFHLDSILEMCRVAREVRIFPLLKISGENCDFLETIMAELKNRGYAVDKRQVPYEFQKKGDEMLQVKASYIV